MLQARQLETLRVASERPVACWQCATPYLCPQLPLVPFALAVWRLRSLACAPGIATASAASPTSRVADHRFPEEEALRAPPLGSSA